LGSEGYLTAARGQNAPVSLLAGQGKVAMIFKLGLVALAVLGLLVGGLAALLMSF
jgi:hypothetical protein